MQQISFTTTSSHVCHVFAFQAATATSYRSADSNMFPWRDLPHSSQYEKQRLAYQEAGVIGHV
jgi:hypothetical protein